MAVDLAAGIMCIITKWLLVRQEAQSQSGRRRLGSLTLTRVRLGTGLYEPQRYHYCSQRSYGLKTTTIGTATRIEVKRHSSCPDLILYIKVILVVGKRSAARSARIDNKCLPIVNLHTDYVFMSVQAIRVLYVKGIKASRPELITYRL